MSKNVHVRPFVAGSIAVLFCACGSQGATTGKGPDASAGSDAPVGGGGDASADGGGVAAEGGGAAPDGGAPDASPDAPVTAGKIEHVILIMQENRSFDHYFGMFPGADGFTLDATGNPTNCNPDPNLDGGCVKAFHDPTDANSGGPHGAAAYDTCFNGGKMDGFIKNAEGGKKNCADPNDPACTGGKLVDVMGYKIETDIPNYWAYAKNFTLLDHLFESDASWSWPMHQYMVSEWAALCSSADPMSCMSNI
ncbi:MAG TPA: alkaline phosphatase family protein, partial [Polyangiaceae bacterium]|nr:alkaline phosphatase family protein [Polyangiaceae bacterium]